MYIKKYTTITKPNTSFNILFVYMLLLKSKGKQKHNNQKKQIRREKTFTLFSVVLHPFGLKTE